MKSHVYVNGLHVHTHTCLTFANAGTVIVRKLSVFSLKTDAQYHADLGSATWTQPLPVMKKFFFLPHVHFRQAVPFESKLLSVSEARHICDGRRSRAGQLLRILAEALSAPHRLSSLS